MKRKDVYVILDTIILSILVGMIIFIYFNWGK
jgi:hypothetical protein